MEFKVPGSMVLESAFPRGEDGKYFLGQPPHYFLIGFPRRPFHRLVKRHGIFIRFAFGRRAAGRREEVTALIFFRALPGEMLEDALSLLQECLRENENCSVVRAETGPSWHGSMRYQFELRSRAKGRRAQRILDPRKAFAPIVGGQ